MRIGPASTKIRVVMLSADDAFAQSVTAGFAAGANIDVQMVPGSLASLGAAFSVEGATVVVIDLEAGREDELQALQSLITRIGTWPPVVVITQAFDGVVARRLIQMRAADFLVKPVSAFELAQACARVAQGPVSSATTDAQIYTFLPAGGGAGVTTIAVQTAM